MILVLMGVAGSGKTTVGRALAARLGWSFADADDLHSPGNVEKMRRGVPLDDADRTPWLESIARLLAHWGREERSVVLACSLLTRRHRHLLGVPRAGVLVVHLVVRPETLLARLRARTHFAPAELLPSQLALLEPPEDALAVDAERPVEEVVEAICARLPPAAYSA